MCFEFSKSHSLDIQCIGVSLYGVGPVPLDLLEDDRADGGCDGVHLRDVADVGDLGIREPDIHLPVLFFVFVHVVVSPVLFPILLSLFLLFKRWLVLVSRAGLPRLRACTRAPPEGLAVSRLPCGSISNRFRRALAPAGLRASRHNAPPGRHNSAAA